MRCFIAVLLPDSLKQEISKVQAQLKETQGDIKWVNPGNMHLTLKFLGGIEPDKVDVLGKELEKELRTFQSFRFTINQVGVFPSLSNPRVIWLGVRKNKDKLVSLQERVEKVVGPLGFSREQRPFHPHLTLGRVRSRKHVGELTGRLESLKLPEFEPVVVEKAILFQSILKPVGAEYKVLKEFVLVS